MSQQVITAVISVPLLGKSDYFFKSWGNENFEFDAEGKKIHPKRILI